MIAKSGRYAGQPIILVCDANCKKAWGINNRPRVYLEDPTQTVYRKGNNRYPDDESIDMDNYALLADQELGDAPDDPGTSEGGESKPRTPDQRLNKWCCRECERCEMVDDKTPVEDFEPTDFSKRFYNMAPHYRDDKGGQSNE